MEYYVKSGFNQFCFSFQFSSIFVSFIRSFYETVKFFTLYYKSKIFDRTRIGLLDIAKWGDFTFPGNYTQP